MQRILSLPCRLCAPYRGLALLALLLFQLPLASAALAQTTPKVLRPLDGDTNSIALAINNRGETAGTSGRIGTGLRFLDDTTAVAWDRKGTPRALFPLPGDPQSEALGINNRGEVAGNSGSFDEEFDSTAVRWDPKGVAMALPPLPGGDGSIANGINAAGEVVGTSAASGERTAVIWDLDGLPRVLSPLLGDSESLGKAINNQGMAAGHSLGPGGTRAVVWSRNGMPRALPPLDDQVDVEVGGINWRGDVVGTIQIVDYAEAPVIWERSGEPRALEVPVFEIQPGEIRIYPAYAFGIDPTREAVGFNGGIQHAALWDRSGTLMDLPPLAGGALSYAYAINNRGEVAGLSLENVPLGVGTFTAVVWR